MAQSYAERNEAAIERGYDSLWDQTESRRDAKEFLEDQGIDYSRDDVWAVADFHNDFVPGDYEGRIDELHDFFDEYVGGDDEAFYDWLDSLYE